MAHNRGIKSSHDDDNSLHSPAKFITSKVILFLNALTHVYHDLLFAIETFICTVLWWNAAALESILNFNFDNQFPAKT